MKERPFLDKSSKPNEKSLRAALGSAHTYYKKVVGLANSYSHEWTFTKSSGWVLKVSDRKKALLYFIPLNDGFRISLAIRESEREAFLRDDQLGIMHDRISSAKKYPEGFALQFDVANRKEFQPVELFIGKLIAIRA